jgi:uncharacterized protein (TIGR03067 family)
MKRAMLAVMVVVLIGPAAVWGRDAKEDLKKLDGTWTPTSGEQAGEKFPDEVLKTISVVIKGGNWTVTVGNATDKGTATVDTSKKPMEMDLVGTEGPNKDRKILCIYELTDDTLKVCYSLDKDAKERPKEFKSAEGSKLVVFTYKRQKP